MFGEHHVWLTGEPDLLMRDEFGDLHMIDHKTVNDPQNILAIPYKRQAYAYDWLLTKSSGRTLTSFIFSIINREKVTEPLQVQSVQFTPELRESFDKSLKSIVKDILAVADKESEAYPNPRKECRYMCSFYKVCPLVSSMPEYAQRKLEAEYSGSSQETIYKKGEV